jgi:hypothetical protein
MSGAVPRGVANAPNDGSKLTAPRDLPMEERVRLNDGNTRFPFSDARGEEFWKNFGGPWAPGIAMGPIRRIAPRIDPGESFRC